jgi:hypothetical protein
MQYKPISLAYTPCLILSLLQRRHFLHHVFLYLDLSISLRDAVVETLPSKRIERTSYTPHIVELNWACWILISFPQATLIFRETRDVVTNTLIRTT